ncbi:MAG: PD40 domain-containing protein, partial [Gemmatimonadetes bacterium]|nr:PD40 domain-containing protein [Gemmatimonadota bacterium]
VSPDGRWIAFVADARLRPDSVVRAERDSLAPLPYDAARDEAPRNDTDIFVIAIDGGTPRRLTTLDGNEGSLAWSPDGRSLAFTSSTTRTGQEELRIVDVAGGTPREVIGDWRYEPGDIEWTPDGQILMTAAIGGRTALFRVDPRTGALDELLGGRRRITGTAYDTAFSRVAFVATAIDAPTELFIANI